MSIDIKEGMFAVLREGQVIGPLKSYKWRDAKPGQVILDEGDGTLWSSTGESLGLQRLPDIVATFATLESASDYVKPDRGMRDLHPDDEELAPAPQTVVDNGLIPALDAILAKLAAARETFCYASPGSDDEFSSLLLGFDTAVNIVKEAKGAP